MKNEMIREEMMMNETELSAEALDDVAGGVLFETVLVGGYVIGTIAAYGTAFALSKFTSKWK